MVNYVFLSVYFYSVPNLRFTNLNKLVKVRLGDICTITGGYAFDSLKMTQKGEYQIIKMGNLYNGIFDLSRNSSFINAPTKKELDYLIQENDILITLTGTTNKKDYGYTVQMEQPKNLLLNQRCALIRASKVNEKYLFYLLNSNDFLKQFYASSTGGTGNQTNVSINDMLDFKVCISNENDQLKISNILSALDKKILTQIKIIDDYNSLKIGIYNWMFKENYADYKLKQLAYIVKGDQINNDQLLSNGSYYMMNGGTSPSGYLDSYNVSENTISISEGGNSCGYVQFNSSPFWSGGHCYTIQNVNSALIDNKYLYHYLKHKEKEIMNLRIGTGLPNIQKRDLENFTILAPNLSIQRKNLALFEMLDEKISVLNEELTILEKQKKYLLCNMFI